MESTLSGLEKLELKARIEQFADALYLAFNENYQQAVKAQLACIGPENLEQTGMFVNFYWLMPFAKMVEKYGLQQYELSFLAMEEITKRNTAEYTIRPYIHQHYERTLEQMYSWSKHENFHLRRLACEGLRPRLPWAKKLDRFIEDPSPVIPVLQSLKDDSSKYVQNSVANHINDLLKDNEAMAIELLQSWTHDASPSRKWIIKHATRKYRKLNSPWALALMGDIGA